MARKGYVSLASSLQVKAHFAHGWCKDEAYVVAGRMGMLDLLNG